MDGCNCGLGCIQVTAFRLGSNLKATVTCAETIKSEVTYIDSGFAASALMVGNNMLLTTNRLGGGIKASCSLVCACDVGLYEPFVPCDGDFIILDGGTFNVLRR